MVSLCTATARFGFGKGEVSLSALLWPKNERELRNAMEAASRIIKPLLPRLREQVLRLERIVVERLLSRMEIMWNGAHAALLTGKSAQDYEVTAGD